MTIVCHMTSAHGSEDVRIFHKECVSLAKAGYDVYLVERGETYDKDGVHIVGIGEVTGGRIHRMATVAKQVYEKALEIDADIYHFHDPELLRFGLKLKKKGKKVIFDSHENVAESINEKTWIPFPLRKLVYFLYSRYEKTVCRKLDSVIYVSPNVEDFYRGLNTNPVLITNYPIFKEKKISEEKERAIAFAGGISEQWNHHHIVKALEQIIECSYVLCGSVGNAYLTQLKALKGWDKVKFLGKIPHSKVAEVLSKSAIGLALLTPGKNTSGKIGTMGNTKIFEEMMAGLPVICTDFDLWREFVYRYNCGMCVDPQDEVQIAKAIEYLLNNPKDARQMGLNGIEAVKKEYNWDTQAKKLIELYKQLEG